MTKPDWIAVDWGTTRLRAWAMTSDGAVLAEAASDCGIGTLRRDGYVSALLDLIAPWLADQRTLVLACGMVGSRQGWVEAPYRTVPCRAVGGEPVRAPAPDPRLAVYIMPGLCQTHPHDVMRGEEIQIAGFLSAQPDFDGVLCLPGSHSKWARISAGKVVSFQTFLTGELFAAIANHTVLRHSLLDEDWDDSAFADAAAETLSHPEMLATRLFSIRAEGILIGLADGAARARLSGLLIGAELAAARSYWQDQRLALIGAAELCVRYAAALSLQDVTPEAHVADDLTRKGLAAVRATLKVTT